MIEMGILGSVVSIISGAIGMFGVWGAFLKGIESGFSKSVKISFVVYALIFAGGTSFKASINSNKEDLLSSYMEKYEEKGVIFDSYKSYGETIYFDGYSYPSINDEGIEEMVAVQYRVGFRENRVFPELDEVLHLKYYQEYKDASSGGRGRDRDWRD